MKNLSNLIRLSAKIAIYVPSTINVDQTADNSKQVDRVLRSLSVWFGGATASDAVGAWVSDTTGATVTEKIKYCFSYCTTDLLNKHIDDVLNLCTALKNEMGQEAISLEINNELYFI